MQDFMGTIERRHWGKEWAQGDLELKGKKKKTPQEGCQHTETESKNSGHWLSWSSWELVLTRSRCKLANLSKRTCLGETCGETILDWNKSVLKKDGMM